MTGTGWRWIKESSGLAIHDAQLAEHGGMPGVGDLSLLLSVLARPQNLATYGNPEADLAALSAPTLRALSVSMHLWMATNVQASFALTFIRKNGYLVQPNQRDAVHTILAVADGKLSETELAQWLRSYMRPLPSE